MSATTDEHQGHSHPYHLVDPSPWPAVGALAAFLLTFGVVLYLHPDMLGEGIEPMLTSLGALVFAPGVLLVVYTMFVWWRDPTCPAPCSPWRSPFPGGSARSSLWHGAVHLLGSDVFRCILLGIF